jgi:hypothetical protein
MTAGPGLSPSGPGAPEGEKLFVLEIPRSRCLCIQLVRDCTHGWEHQVLCNLASANSSPDALIIDDSRLQHVLVSAGASFQKPATAYLDKLITLMPAIHQCLLSLMDLLNQPTFQAQSAISKLNEALESWRVRYNRHDGAGTI